MWKCQHVCFYAMEDFPHGVLHVHWGAGDMAQCSDIAAPPEEKIND